MPVIFNAYWLPHFLRHMERLSVPILAVAASSGSPEIGCLLCLRAVFVYVFETSDDYSQLPEIRKRWRWNAMPIQRRQYQVQRPKTVVPRFADVCRAPVILRSADLPEQAFRGLG